LSRVEVESFVKSFLLFSTSLGLLIATLFYLNYTKEIQTLDDTLLSEMRLCSYNLDCQQFEIDFVPITKQLHYTLYKSSQGLSSYFPIPSAQEYVMQIHFEEKAYQLRLKKLQHEAYWQLFGTLVVVLMLSVLFSLYALYPLRNALTLTQEFIKDILHDFNTPLGTLRLNSAMLKKEIGENKKLERIEQSVQNVLDLQENLRAYLFNHTQQREQFELSALVKTRVALIEKNFATLHFVVDIETQQLKTNRAAFTRILDNLISNAAKYNNTNGSVTLAYDVDTTALQIIDTGKGIKNPKRIFERFYKEQDRGIGIGLHIVKKLCEELDITLYVESKLDQGTTFSLALHKLVTH